MTILYLDAIAGISGDMTVAALLDLGLPIDYLQQELEKLALPQDSFNLSTETVVRQGMHGRHFAVHLPHEHHHHGEHHSHHHHRNYSDIRRMISESSISERAKELSLLIFLKLAEAEAKAHQVPVDDVCFHEVGAVDSIVDIVGAAIGLDWLDVNQLYVSPLPLGGGFVETAHGRLPVPAPATAALLKGFVLHARCGDGERVTPTGAAILAALATPVSAMPDMAITKTGQGAGTKDFGDCPNILRAFIGEPLKSGDKLVEARCNLDDVTGEQLGYVMERLFESGALDVWHTSIQMKKQRPGVMLSFLCAEKEFDCLCKMVFAETGTLGLRYQQIERLELERTVEELPTCFGKVRFKLGEHGMKPEYDDCRRIAREQGQPLRTVQKRLMEAKGE